MRHVRFLALSVVLLIVPVAACTGSDSTVSTTTASETATTQGQDVVLDTTTEVVGILAVIDVIDSAGFHGMAEEISAIDPVTPVLAAIDVVDSAGFHGMAEEIEAAESVEDVSPRSLGTVENVLTATRTVAWPDELTGAFDVFADSLETLAAALGGTDLDAMKQAAAPVHETQHGLSHDVYEWLATTDPTQADSGSDNSVANDDQTDSTLNDIYADAEVIEIEVTDWEWNPTEIHLDLGVPVILEITNTGVMPHGIWVPGLGINEETPPGETVRVPFTPEAAGEHFVGCANDLCGTAEQHASMTATFIVSG